MTGFVANVWHQERGPHNNGYNNVDHTWDTGFVEKIYLFNYIMFLYWFLL